MRAVAAIAVVLALVAAGIAVVRWRSDTGAASSPERAARPAERAPSAELVRPPAPRREDASRARVEPPQRLEPAGATAAGRALEPALVRGRCVLPDGAPLAGVRLVVHVRGAGGWEDVEGESGADVRFGARFALPRAQELALALEADGFCEESCGPLQGGRPRPAPAFAAGSPRGGLELRRGPRRGQLVAFGRMRPAHRPPRRRRRAAARP